VYVENHILQKLSHPGIVKQEGIFEEADKVFIVLEYIENGDLFELMKHNGKL
jgi:serine/threonine protein kinase